MARTAPVPNLPPIPGMCPSIAVLGGGGDGGGGGGNGAGNGDGNGPGNGDGSGDGANADGTGAGNCGQGGAGGCTNCGSQTAAGDPVDVTTGAVFTTPHEDLALSGPFALRVLRRYHSAARRRDVGLGWGWTHSLAWSIERTRAGLMVRPPFASERLFPIDEVDGGSFGDGGWILSRDRDRQLKLDTGDDFFHYFEPADRDERSFRLARVEHRTRNKVELRYRSDGRLSQIIDAAGRAVDVRLHGDGHIAALSVANAADGRSIVFATFDYDAAGQLVRFRDADRVGSDYTYDADHRLLTHVMGGIVTFHFLYDEQGRCIETWGEPTDKGTDPALDPKLPTHLADGVTKARGIYHTKLNFASDGSSEIVDSTRVLRFDSDPTTGLIAKGVGGDGGVSTRDYDEFGMPRHHTDAEGAVTAYQWTERGKLTRETDAIGAETRIVRDGYGRPIQVKDPEGGLVDAYRDRYGNVETVIDANDQTTSYKFDHRSLLTSATDASGATTRFASDAHGNLVETTFSNGEKFVWAYDYYGRVTARRAPNGFEERYVYSDAGRLLTWEIGPSRRVTYGYDSLGRCVSEARSEGTTTFAWGGVRWLCQTTQPNGDSLRLGWNRDGQVTTILNPAGEQTQFEYSSAGYLAEFTLFDGATTKIRYDKMGRWVQWKRDDVTIAAERDEVGRLLAMDHGGDTEAFAYNLRDEHIGASTAGVKCTFSRDAAGYVSRETQEAFGSAVIVDYRRDACGRIVEITTSGGKRLTMGRDVAGRVVRFEVDGRREIAIERGAMGTVARRVLPGGAAITYDYDVELRRKRDGVEPLSSGARRSDEPAWIGASRPSVLERRYDYSDRGDLLAVHEPSGVRSYAYDARQRLTSCVSPESQERLVYDRAGNHHEQGADAPPRSYGAGNRLERMGEWTYVWSPGGFLLERRRGTNGSTEIHRYHWSQRRFLDKVETPEGNVVQFHYDAFGRRLGKSVFTRRTRGATPKLARRVRLVYAGDLIVQERDEDVVTKAVKTRTFLYEDGHANPFAHIETTTDSESVVYYLTDVLGTPEVLVDEAGLVVGELKRTVFGRTCATTASKFTTPIRFPGQYEDVETGLHYNRYRYYDPDAGRYISPDPIALNGGLNVYQYCPNPVGFFDALGLAAHTSTVGLTTGSGPNRETWVPTPGAHEGTGLRRRGNADGTHNPSGDLMPGFASTEGHTVPGATRVQPTAGSPTAPGGRGGTLNTNSVNGHSEQNSLEWAERNFNGTQLNGSQMNLGGQRPPCPRCHRAMQEFAARHNSTVEYNYPVDNRVAYDGSLPRNSSTTPARAGFTATGQGYHTDLMSMYAASEMAGQAFGDNYVRQQSTVGGMEAFVGGASHEDVHGAYNTASEQQTGLGHATPNASGRGAVQNNAHEAHRMAGAGDPNEALPPAGGTRFGRGGGVGRR